MSNMEGTNKQPTDTNNGTTTTTTSPVKQDAKRKSNGFPSDGYSDYNKPEDSPQKQTKNIPPGRPNHSYNARKHYTTATENPLPVKRDEKVKNNASRCHTPKDSPEKRPKTTPTVNSTPTAKLMKEKDMTNGCIGSASTPLLTSVHTSTTDIDGDDEWWSANIAAMNEACRPYDTI